MEPAPPQSRKPFLFGLAPDTEARVVALVLISALYGLSLQTMRMLLHPEEVWSDVAQVGPRDFLAFLASSMLLQAGLAVSCLGLLLLPSKRSGRAWVTFGLQGLVFVLLLVETGAQAYFFSTGQTLDWPLFVDALSRPKEVLTLGLGSVQWTIWAGLAAAALVVGAAPWLAAARARKRKADVEALARSRPKAFALAFAGVGVALLGLLPGTSLANDAAAPRDPVLNLLVSAFPSKRAPVGFGDLTPERYFHVAIEPVPGPPGSPPPRPRNVVLVILESTRASATTVYDPKLPTTPFLADLATRSLVVERMQAVIPATKKALRHILCGFEASHSPRAQALTLGVMTRCLPNLLRARKYHTVFFQSADEHWDFRTASAFSLGFNEFYGPASFDREGFGRPNMAGYDDEIMLAPSRQWLKKHRDAPFFATYLTVDTHFECWPVTKYGNVRFSSQADLDCYLNAVRRDDVFLRELIEQYRDLGLADSTVFVIVGDHGEAFGEHGRRTHNDVPWQEALQVPALIYDPNGLDPKPGLVKGTWAQTDLAPTLVDLLGYKVTEGRFQGSSLLRPAPPGRIVHSACIGEENCLASIEGDLKLIHHFWHKKVELFDLAADPLERVNLAPKLPELVAARVAELTAWDDDLKRHYTWFELHRSQPLASGDDRSRPPLGAPVH